LVRAGKLASRIGNVTSGHYSLFTKEILATVDVFDMIAALSPHKSLPLDPEAV